MWLLIDDIRTFGVDMIARNAEAGRIALCNITWDGVIMDHDLGCKETGYDVLKWALEHRCLPERVQLCTMNPVGRVGMANLLRSAGYSGQISDFILDKP